MEKNNIYIGFNKFSNLFEVLTRYLQGYGEKNGHSPVVCIAENDKAKLIIDLDEFFENILGKRKNFNLIFSKSFKILLSERIKKWENNLKIEKKYPDFLLNLGGFVVYKKTITHNTKYGEQTVIFFNEEQNIYVELYEQFLDYTGERKSYRSLKIVKPFEEQNIVFR